MFEKETGILLFPDSVVSHRVVQPLETGSHYDALYTNSRLISQPPTPTPLPNPVAMFWLFPTSEMHYGLPTHSTLIVMKPKLSPVVDPTSRKPSLILTPQGDLSSLRHIALHVPSSVLLGYQ